MNQFCRWTTLALLLGAGLIRAQGQSATTSGVLIGSFTNSDHHYSTMYVHHEGGRSGVEVIPNLLVPTNTGFFAVGNYYTLEAGEVDPLANFLIPVETAEEHISVQQVPNPTDPVGYSFHMESGGHADANCANISRTLSFVSGEYISLRKVGNYDCGVHPDGEIENESFHFADRKQRPVSISMLGAEMARSFDAEAQKAIRRECKEEAKVSETGWRIVRGPGKWVIEGWVPTHRLCDYGDAFTLPGSAPEPITGPARVSFDWAAMQRAVPGLVDAFESPSKDMLVAITRSELMVFLPENGKLGVPVMSKPRIELGMDPSFFGEPFESDEVVMVQWAVGPATERWLKQIRLIQK